MQKGERSRNNNGKDTSVGIGDLVSSISNFFGNPENNDGLCILQGILAESGALASICWVTAISFSIFIVITSDTPPTSGDISKWLKLMHIIIWSYILLCTLLPLFTNSYGPAGGWCWIKGTTTSDKVWRFLLFYIPLWSAISFMIFAKQCMWCFYTFFLIKYEFKFILYYYERVMGI